VKRPNHPTSVSGVYVVRRKVHLSLNAPLSLTANLRKHAVPPRAHSFIGFAESTMQFGSWDAVLDAKSLSPGTPHERIGLTAHLVRVKGAACQRVLPGASPIMDRVALVRNHLICPTHACLAFGC
jgi:hypothetical protein